LGRLTENGGPIFHFLFNLIGTFIDRFDSEYSRQKEEENENENENEKEMKKKKRKGEVLSSPSRNGNHLSKCGVRR